MKKVTLMCSGSHKTSRLHQIVHANPVDLTSNYKCCICFLAHVSPISQMLRLLNQFKMCAVAWIFWSINIANPIPHSGNCIFDFFIPRLKSSFFPYNIVMTGQSFAQCSADSLWVTLSGASGQRGPLNACVWHHLKREALHWRWC